MMWYFIGDINLGEKLILMICFNFLDFGGYGGWICSGGFKNMVG